MARIIDELVVLLGLETKNFKTSQEYATKRLEKLDKGQKELSASTDKTSAAVLKLGKSFLTTIGIATSIGGFAKMTLDTVAAGAQLNRFGKELNVSTENLGTWAAAASTFGGSIEDVAQTLGKFRQVQGDLALGRVDTGYLNALGLLGVQFDRNSDAADTMRKTLIALKDFQDKYGTTQANTIANALGISKAFQDLVRSGKDINTVFEEARKQGAIARQNAEAADQAQQSFDRLGNAIKSAALNTANLFAPSMEEGAKSLTDFVGEMKKGENSSNALARSISAIGTVATSTFATIADGFRIMSEAIKPFLSGLDDEIDRIFRKADQVDLFGIRSGLAEGRALPTDPKVLEERRRHAAGTSGATGTPIDSSAYVAPTSAAELTKRRGNAPRNVRNFNPGNLNFAGQPGASLETGTSSPRFAAFANADAGVRALGAQLERYAARGTDTVASIVAKYAPPSENNTKAYIQSLSRKLGVSSDQKLNVRDPGTMRALLEGITTIEGGAQSLRAFQPAIDTHIASISGRQSPTMVAQNSAPGQITNSTNIGTLNVQTNATDAQGMAKGALEAVRRQSLVMNMAGGLS